MSSVKKTSPIKYLYDSVFFRGKHNAQPPAVTSSGAYDMNPAVTSSGAYDMNPPTQITSVASSYFTHTNTGRDIPPHNNIDAMSVGAALSTPSPRHGQQQISTVNEISTVNDERNDRISSLEAENEELQRQLRAYQQFTNNSTGKGRGKNSMAKKKTKLYTQKELLDCSTISEYVRDIFFQHHKILAFEEGWQNFNSAFSQDVIANTQISPPSHLPAETYWSTVLLPNFVKTFNERKNNFRTSMKREFAGK